MFVDFYYFFSIWVNEWPMIYFLIIDEWFPNCGNSKFIAEPAGKKTNRTHCKSNWVLIPESFDVYGPTLSLFLSSHFDSILFVHSFWNPLLSAIPIYSTCLHCSSIDCFFASYLMAEWMIASARASFSPSYRLVPVGCGRSLYYTSISLFTIVYPFFFVVCHSSLSKS